MLNKLIIGTAQFGIDYGITNLNGKLKDNELDKIFKFCIDNNILYFDTAQDYGNSEDIISKYFSIHNNLNIITKAKFTNKNINDTLQISLDKFNVIECFLLHSFEDYNNKNLITTLLDYKKQKRINKIGVSIYTVEEAIILLKENIVDIIQIPFNYLDNQWIYNKEFQHLIINSNIEIHSRSIFLQGILLNLPTKYPTNIPIADFIFLNNIIDDITNELKITRLELCFAYVNSFKWISKFLIGIDNLNHLIMNYNIISKNIILSQKDIEYIYNKITNDKMTNDKTNKINPNIRSPLNWKF